MAYVVYADGVDSIYGEGYFPRKIHYLKDAKKLAERVKSLGGKAEVKKEEKYQNT